MNTSAFHSSVLIGSYGYAVMTVTCVFLIAAVVFVLAVVAVVSVMVVATCWKAPVANLRTASTG